MKQKYTNEQIDQFCSAYENGTRASTICAQFNIPRSTFYSFIKRRKKSLRLKLLEISTKNFQLLKRQVNRLETIIEILQSIDCNANSPLDVKLYNLEKLYGKYNVHVMCEALQVSRGTFYNHILRNKRDNTWYAKRKEELRLKIQQVYDDSHQIFGAGKITATLKANGEKVSERMVRLLMQDMGLISIRDDAKDFYDKEQVHLKNHLNQQFDVSRPNEVWVSDVTCFRFNNKNYYICVVLDLYARRIVSYRIGQSNSTNLVRSTFKMAYDERKPTLPLMFHTDRGGPYRSKTMREYLQKLGVKQSFSRAYVPYDNSVVESFFASLKREELYRIKYRSENEFKTAVDNYMTFYNFKRPHYKNQYKTPDNKELDYYKKQTEFNDRKD